MISPKTRSLLNLKSINILLAFPRLIALKQSAGSGVRVPHNPQISPVHRPSNFKTFLSFLYIVNFSNILQKPLTYALYYLCDSII